MKKNLLRKSISLSMAMTLTMGLLAGCGNTEVKESNVSSSEVETQSSVVSSATESEVAEPAATYPLDTDVTLTIAFPTNGNITANYKGLAETPWFAEYQEKTGVKLEVMEMDNEAYKLMLLGGELPDILWMYNNFLPNGELAAVEDEIILPLNDYMEYMPNYQAYLDSDEEAGKAAVLSDGSIFGAVFFAESAKQVTTSGMMVRQDWLDELNMELPTTLDDFYNMLVAFKEKGAEVPLSATLANLQGSFMKYGLTDCFDLITTDWYQVDGKVSYGYAQPEVKDMFAFMNKLYTEGLLDPEFATIDDATEKSNFLTGRSGVTFAYASAIKARRAEAITTTPGFEMMGFAPLTGEEGKPSKSGYAVSKNKYGAGFITTACEHPEVAAQLLDYGYSEEGHLFFNFGTEGTSYNMVDGKPVFTDLITKNPNGWNLTQAVSAYAHAPLIGPFVQCLDYTMSSLALDEATAKSVENFGNTDFTNYMLLGTAMPSEHLDEYNKILAEITTFISEIQVEYITGQKSLDNFEKDYLETLKSLKVDRLIELQQLAYDAYVVE